MSEPEDQQKTGNLEKLGLAGDRKPQIIMSEFNGQQEIENLR